MNTNKIRQYLSNLILNAVMTNGYGLQVNHNYSVCSYRPPTHQFENFNKYEDWVILQLQQYCDHEVFLRTNNLDYTDENGDYYSRFSDIFNIILPLFSSSRANLNDDDTDYIAQLFDIIQMGQPDLFN